MLPQHELLSAQVVCIRLTSYLGADKYCCFIAKPAAEDRKKEKKKNFAYIPLQICSDWATTIFSEVPSVLPSKDNYIDIA